MGCPETASALGIYAPGVSPHACVTVRGTRPSRDLLCASGLPRASGQRRLALLRDAATRPLCRKRRAAYTVDVGVHVYAHSPPELACGPCGCHLRLIDERVYDAAGFWEGSVPAGVWIRPDG